ncbi:glutathione S-transferase family protein [Shimia sp.]|uniref:glutathione S-transferase family protein n=1 Tax=Shimia sp. TaxID=1954381 RepID=UPI003BAA2AB4
MLSYETLLVDRRNKAQFSPDYLALNPNGTIPVLETPDGVLFETAAISDVAIGEHRKALAPPPGTPLRAPFLKWMFWCSNTFQIDLRHFFYPEKFIGDDPDHQAQLRRIFRQRKSEQDLADSGKRPRPDSRSGRHRDAHYCSISMCPACCAGPNFTPNLPDHRWFDINRYPTLLRICSRAEARASTHAAQIAEGLGPTPFTNPALAAPPEGSAT